MITLQRMAEHRFSNVYNYQCLMLILTFPLIPFPSFDAVSKMRMRIPIKILEPILGNLNLTTCCGTHTNRLKIVGKK